MAKPGFSDYFFMFEKMQSFVIGDLRRATINAQTNFLVAMGVFNYLEILGGFSLPNGTSRERFDFVFQKLLPPPYKLVFDDLDNLTNKGAYDCLRCGMTHEYLVKIYVLKDATASFDYTVYGVDDEAAFAQNILTKDCGLELVKIEKKINHLRIYNPRLIHDLNRAFEELKKALIDDKSGCRRNFIARSKEIRLEQFA